MMKLSRNRYSFLCIIVISIMPLLLKAQNAIEDIKKINNAYLLNNQFSMQMVVSGYEGKDSKNAFEEEEGFANRNGELLHVKLGDFESVKTRKLLLSIDHKNKIIVISEPVLQNGKLPGDMASSLKVLLDYCEKVSYKDVSKKVGKYVMDIPTYTYEQFEFEFNKDNYFLEKLVMIMNSKLSEETSAKLTEKQKVKLVIEYKNINTQPEFNNQEFTSWKYIYKDGNEYRSTEEYKEYAIINQLPNK